jgi:GNAT superfamily N-acetyltransferase
MRTYLSKAAIKDIPPGKYDEARESHDYSHLLPEHLKADHKLTIAEDVGESGTPTVSVSVTDPNEVVGKLLAVPFAPYIRIGASSVKPEHREKGIGAAMYTALYAHARNKMGLTRVKGGKHSTLAHHLHEKLAAQYNLAYEAEQTGRAYRSPFSWRDNNDDSPGSFDFAYKSYSHGLDPEEAQPAPRPTKLARSEPTLVPSRYLAKQEPNLDGWMDLEGYEEAAMEQLGYAANLHRHIDAACRMLSMSKANGISISAARNLLEEVDTIPEAVLAAYHIAPDADNLFRLDTFLKDSNLLKDESSLNVESYKITPARSEATEVANAIQRAANGGFINPVKLNGKHSKGTMLAKDPQTKKIYLLKPGSGKNSPASGVSQIDASQSEREAAFWHVADYIGIGDSFPRADLVLVNNHQTAAMELLPINFHNLGQKKKEDPNLPTRIMEPYRQNSTLFKWSFIDYVLGNPDRHSQNLMADPDNKIVRLIDHGSALAGSGFDPSGDENSFIPFYLRAWTGQKFTKMSPHDRLRYMPSLGDRGAQIFDQWVEHVNEHHVAEILSDYHVDPSAALERIAKIRAMPGAKWMVLNRLWAGAA